MNKKEILLARHFAMLAMVYAVIAMALGVFYREFTKFSGFAGRTSLSFLHTHYFALGMVFFQMCIRDRRGGGRPPPPGDHGAGGGKGD